MSYTWYDVTCNVGICKSKSTLRDTSYLIRRMTGRALSYCSMRVAGCALYHKVVLHCDVTPRYTVMSLRVTLWHHSALPCDVTLRYAVTSLCVALWRHSTLRCDVTPCYTVTSLHVTLWRDFSPERHPAIRHIHVKICPNTHSVFHKSHTDWPGVQPGPLQIRWQPNHLSHGMVS